MVANRAVDSLKMLDLSRLIREAEVVGGPVKPKIDPNLQQLTGTRRLGGACHPTVNFNAKRNGFVRSASAPPSKGLSPGTVVAVGGDHDMWVNSSSSSRFWSSKSNRFESIAEFIDQFIGERGEIVDEIEWVLDLVRDTCGQLPERRHFLGMEQAGLC
jgi:hypothetical protein